MRFADSTDGERIKCLIYDILSKNGTLRFLKIYAHIIIAVADDDYEMQRQYNIQRILNSMEECGLINRSLNFEYSIKPVEIQSLPSETKDLGNFFCDGNFGGYNETLKV